MKPGTEIIKSLTAATELERLQKENAMLLTTLRACMEHTKNDNLEHAICDIICEISTVLMKVRGKK